MEKENTKAFLFHYISDLTTVIKVILGLFVTTILVFEKSEKIIKSRL